MNVLKKCVVCRKPLPFRPQCKDHRYCRNADCQRQRKNQWQRAKRLKDKAYQQNEQDSGRAWRKRHPDYWRDYRDNNPEYTKRNRQQQAVRNKQRGKRKVKPETIPEQSAAIPEQDDVVVVIASKRFQLTEIVESAAFGAGFRRRRPPPSEVGTDCKQGRVGELTCLACGR